MESAVNESGCEISLSIIIIIPIIFLTSYLGVKVAFNLEPTMGPINTIRYNHNGKLLVTGESTGFVRIFGLFFPLRFFFFFFLSFSSI